MASNQPLAGAPMGIGNGEVDVQTAEHVEGARPPQPIGAEGGPQLRME